MATYYARKAGNINASDVWATTPSGTASAVTFASGDVLMANSFAITVNVTTNLGSTGQVRNDTTGGATAGGSFTLANGVTLTANIFAGATICVVLNGGAFSIYGNINGGTGTSTGGVASTGNSNTLSVFGNVLGGNGNSSAGIYCGSSTLNLTVEGNVVGGSGNQSSGITYVNSGTGNIIVTGNVTGGTSSSAAGITTNLTSNNVTVTGIVTGGTLSTNLGCSVLGVLTINGLAVGGVAGPGVVPGTAVTATRAVGNGFGLGSVGLAAAPGISHSGTAVVEVSELEYGLRGMPPVVGIVRLKKLSSNTVIFNWVDSGAAKILVDATQGQMPAATDVRSGVSYASGALTGSAFIPSPATVATGVPVDNTVGTAALSANDVAAAVWGAASRTITGGVVDTLTNAPSVPSAATIASQVRTELGTELGRIDAAISSRLAPSGTLATVTTLTNAPSVPSASAIASQVRTELSTELGRIDAPVSGATAPSASTVATAVRTELATELARVDQNISSRLASSAYTAPANSDIAAIKAKTDNLPASPAATGDIPSANITAIKAKTDALVTDRLAQCSTVATTGAQLAAALS